MREHLLVAAAVALALGACGQSSRAPAGTSAGEFTLTCEAFREMTGETLAAAYGAENLVDQTLPGPEGETYEATIVYAADPARRLEIVWQDHAAKTRIAGVAARDEGNSWRGPNGLSVGEALVDVETANGQPFSLWGFGWDYGGWVSDWNGGAFASRDGCNTRVRFEPTADASGAQGDAEFSSDNAAVRRAAPRVEEFGLVYVGAQPE